MKHIFKREEDAENLALDIAAFLRKWGMWKDTQIFASSKCYTYDENGGLWYEFGNYWNLSAYRAL